MEAVPEYLAIEDIESTNSIAITYFERSLKPVVLMDGLLYCISEAENMLKN